MSLVNAIMRTENLRPLAAVPPTLRSPYVKFKAGAPDDIVTGDVPQASTQAEYMDAVRKSCEVEIPAGKVLELVEAWHNTHAWTRESVDQDKSVTAPTWRYRFKVIDAEEPAEARLPLAEIDSYVRSRRTMPPAARTRDGELAEIVNLADLQIGKRDIRGGTPELEDRFYGGMDEVIKRIKRSKPTEIVLSELGDGCEGFQNTPAQAQTNDRNHIAQLDLHATFLTYAAVELAKLAPKLTVVGVPSNHMEVRENGKAVGGPDNDYGLLTLSQLKRSFGLNPKAFSHVEFAWPGEHESSIVLNVAGINTMFTHGHYSRGAGAADSVPKWLEKQFAAESDAHRAQVIFTGHYHHLRIQQIIGGRWWLQAPALDNGSAWLRRINGQGTSDAGILTVRMTPAGWSNAQVLGNKLGLAG